MLDCSCYDYYSESAQANTFNYISLTTSNLAKIVNIEKIFYQLFCKYFLIS